MSSTTIPQRVHEARDLAQVLLDGMTERWRHTIAVARRAEEVAGTVDDADRNDLIAAAWLHDIGYAERIRDTGFHPLDGARHLERLHWPGRISALVAHHSGARFVARARGLAGALAAYPDERSAVSDALTYADQTVGPRGERLTITDRLADMLRRHGPDSPNAHVHDARAPYILAAGDRVRLRLAAGANPQR
jgi:putative nucleotidyltransferase with HDIG domain